MPMLSRGARRYRSAARPRQRLHASAHRPRRTRRPRAAQGREAVRPAGHRGSAPFQVRRDVIRVTDGPQRGWFAAALDGRAYRVAEDSNRMGLRLLGPKLECARELLTEGVSLGAIQVPPEGQPIILFVEHQTTGGYPKIANVISADLPAVGQLRPRDEVRFETVTMERALELLREQEERICSLI